MARAHIMYSVEVRCYAEELATVMSKMREWLDAQRFEPEIAVGMPITEHPRSEPDVRHSRIRLPPWIDGEKVVRTRPSPGDTLARLGVRRVLACPVFSSAPSLRSTNSDFGRPTPFAGFPATMEGSDFSPLCIIGFGSSRSRCGPQLASSGQTRDLPVPGQGAYAHAGVYDRAGPSRRSR